MSRHYFCDGCGVRVADWKELSSVKVERAGVFAKGPTAEYEVCEQCARKVVRAINKAIKELFV